MVPWTRIPFLFHIGKQQLRYGQENIQPKRYNVLLLKSQTNYDMATFTVAIRWIAVIQKRKLKMYKQSRMRKKKEKKNNSLEVQHFQKIYWTLQKDRKSLKLFRAHSWRKVEGQYSSTFLFTLTVEIFVLLPVFKKNTELITVKKWYLFLISVAKD